MKAHEQIRKARDRPQTECDREPIHVPGHIQPHGVLIATAPNSTIVSHVSSNFEASTGISPARALGADLGGLFGSALTWAVATLLQDGISTPSNTLRLKLAIRRHPYRSVTAHRHLGRTIIELEAPPPRYERARSVARAQAIIMTLRNATTVDALCHIATHELRKLTGYDRVMMYRFDSEGHGTVIAEDKDSRLEPYLGLKYPASDIPQQARHLYVQQRVRSIPDVQYVPETLLATGEDDALDMTFCALRGVSPIHREYMANMAVRATLAISLLQDNGLWGMIVCHHGSPLTQSAEVRAFCDVIGQLVSVLLQKVVESEELAERLRRDRSIATLRSEMEAADNIARALARQAGPLLDLVGASGALIRIGEETITVGNAPSSELATSIVGGLRQQHLGEVWASSDAGRPGHVAEDCADRCSGILLMPILNNPGDVIAWFRPEQRQAVLWAGDPQKSTLLNATTGRLSPRKSFAAWSEQVRGQSEPWAAIDVEMVNELRRTITGALLRHAELKLAQLSAYDPLTHLANRRTLKARLEQCRRQSGYDVSSMLFFDLDRFKMINDSLGHAAGDQVLIQVAERLTRSTPQGATAARLGGDEFVVFLPGATQSEAELLADAIMRKLCEPLMIGEHEHYVTVSVGVACSNAEGLDQLLREADEAMYAAKRQGGGRSVCFHPALHTTVLTANQIQQDLFRALEKNELQVYYQPIVNVPSRAISGFEALVRWQHATRGWISPAEFIPRAEETGLITRIGAYVFESAVCQLKEWLGKDGTLTMSINVSSRQLLEGSFSSFVAGTLAREAVKPRSICIEVTESALMHDSAVRELHRLRELGIRVAVDDFGTGYSSLAYLQKLPVDIVKLDQSFTSRLGTTQKADRFFSAILNLAHTIDLDTVAEGCETEAQWEIIRHAGCKAVQGWLIARALDADGIAALLRSGSRAAA